MAAAVAASRGASVRATLSAGTVAQPAKIAAATNKGIMRTHDIIGASP
jgi:hypothetical protein